MEVNVHEAKTHLSRLLRRVSAGEEITISRAGVPVARLIAAAPTRGSRPMGMDRNSIWMADDFDASDPKLEALFQTPIDTAPPAVRKAAKGKKA
jgi:prevent-host-death family protein